MAVAVGTAILVALFGMPIVDPLPDTWISAISWFTDQLSYADKFFDVPTAIILVEQIIAFEVAIMSFRIVLWGIRLIKA